MCVYIWLTRSDKKQVYEIWSAYLTATRTGLLINKCRYLYKTHILGTLYWQICPGHKQITCTVIYSKCSLILYLYCIIVLDLDGVFWIWCTVNIMYIVYHIRYKTTLWKRFKELQMYAVSILLIIIKWYTVLFNNNLERDCFTHRL